MNLAATILVVLLLTACDTITVNVGTLNLDLRAAICREGS